MQLHLGEPVDLAGCRLWACAEFDVTIADSEGDEHALEQRLGGISRPHLLRYVGSAP